MQIYHHCVNFNYSTTDIFFFYIYILTLKCLEYNSFIAIKILYTYLKQYYHLISLLMLR